MIVGRIPEKSFFGCDSELKVQDAVFVKTKKSLWVTHNDPRDCLFLTVSIVVWDNRWVNFSILILA